MKKSKFSEEQIVEILREGGSGMAVKAVCAKHNISDQTYYKWKVSVTRRAVLTE